MFSPAGNSFPIWKWHFPAGIQAGIQHNRQRKLEIQIPSLEENAASRWKWEFPVKLEFCSSGIRQFAHTPAGYRAGNFDFQEEISLSFSLHDARASAFAYACAAMLGAVKIQRKGARP